MAVNHRHGGSGDGAGDKHYIHGVKYSGDGLAIVTTQEELFLVSISAIPMVSSRPTITSVGTSWGLPGVIAQNAWITIPGRNLAPPTTAAGGVSWSKSPEFASGQMPTALNGVSVTVDGKPAFVEWICSAVSSALCQSDQINALAPLDSAAGSAAVVVTDNQSVSSPFPVTMQVASPALPQLGGGYVLATHADYSLVGPTSLFPGQTTPAQRGETIVLFAFGLGLPTTGITNGSATQAGPLPSPLPACSIGSGTASVIAANLISPGLYQLNLTVPTSAPSGDNAVQCTYDSASTPFRTSIAIQ